MAQLTLRKIEKRFGATPVLRGVDIDVPDKSFVVLVGPSGCGKSTLLRVIAGLEQCDSGRIRFDEDDVTELTPRERDIAMVFQSYALYPHLTVRDNLAFGLTLRKTPRAQIDERIAEVSEMLGLSELLERYPRQLSGGQRQRVAMGRAIVRRPRLFLFDEPLSNLDASLRAQVRVDIRKLHDRLGATSVYVTHDQVEAMTLADRLFVLKGGLVEQAGAPLEVYSRPATRFVAAFLGSPAMNFLEGQLDDELRRVRGTGFELEVAKAQVGDAKPGDAVVVGVRPHDVFLAEPGQTGSLRARVEVLEALGSESFVHGKVGEAPVVVRLSGNARPERGTELELRADPADIHLFDPDSGEALWRAAKRRDAEARTELDAESAEPERRQ